MSRTIVDREVLLEQLVIRMRWIAGMGSDSKSVSDLLQELADEEKLLLLKGGLSSDGKSAEPGEPPVTADDTLSTYVDAVFSWL